MKPLWHHLLLPQKLTGERTKHSLSFPPTLGCQKCVLCRVQHKNPPAAAWEQLLPHPAPPHCQLWQSSHFSTSQDLPGTGFPLNLFTWGGFTFPQPKQSIPSVRVWPQNPTLVRIWEQFGKEMRAQIRIKMRKAHPCTVPTGSAALPAG